MQVTPVKTGYPIPPSKQVGLGTHPQTAIRFSATPGKAKKSPFFANESRFQCALNRQKKSFSLLRASKAVLKFPIALSTSLIMTLYKPSLRAALKKNPLQFLINSNQHFDQAVLKPLFSLDQRFQKHLGQQKDHALAQGDIEGALRSIHKAIKLKPESWEGYVVLGRVTKDLYKLQKGGEPDKTLPVKALVEPVRQSTIPFDEIAIDAYLKSIALSPAESRSALVGLAEVYQTKGDKIKAVYYLNELVDSHGDWPIAQELLAKAYADMGQVDKAISTVTERIVEEPGHWPHYRDLFLLYKSRGANNPAEASLVELTQKHPQLVFPLEKLGELYEKQGDVNKATETYQKALTVESGKSTCDKRKLQVLQDKITQLNKKANIKQ